MAHDRTIDPYDPYRAELLPPARVRELSRLTPWIPVRDAALCWAMILGAWAVAAAFPAWWVLLLAGVVVGTRYYALFIIGHDGLHRRILPTQRANDLFNDLVILGPLGAITRLNNRNHLAHHRHLGNDEDPDRYRHACFNKYDRLHLVGFLTGATSAFRAVHQVFIAPRRGAVAAAATPADDQELWDDQRGVVRTAYRGDRYTLRDAVILGGWQVALIGGLTWTFGWWGYPVMWLAPVYVFTFLADLLRSFVEHSHPESDAAADHHRLITFDSNPVERWFVAPMNMNYHVAHHLWVGIPYYRLPQADAEMQRHPLHARLERRGSYLAYLVRYWLALPLDECRPAPSQVA